jgi:hypothetical protein
MSDARCWSSSRSRVGACIDTQRAHGVGNGGTGQETVWRHSNEVDRRVLSVHAPFMGVGNLLQWQVDGGAWLWYHPSHYHEELQY